MHSLPVYERRKQLTAHAGRQGSGLRPGAAAPQQQAASQDHTGTTVAPPRPLHSTLPHALSPWMSPVYQASSSFQYTLTESPTAASPLGGAAAAAALGLGLAALLPTDLAGACTAATAAGERAAAAGTASALSLAAATSPAAALLSSFAGEGAAAEGVAAPSCTRAAGGRQQAATAGLSASFIASRAPVRVYSERPAARTSCVAAHLRGLGLGSEEGGDGSLARQRF